MDWSVDAGGQSGFAQLEEAERRVEYVYRTRERLQAIPESRLTDAGEVARELTEFADDLGRALDDDLNMPVGLAVTAELLKQVNDLAERAKAKKGQLPRAAIAAAHRAFDVLGRVLGLGQDDPAAVLARVRARRVAKLGLREDDVEQKISERKQARVSRDFARADAIRDEIAALRHRADGQPGRNDLARALSGLYQPGIPRVGWALHPHFVLLGPAPRGPIS